MGTEQSYIVLFLKSSINQLNAGSQLTFLTFCNYKLLHVLKCYVLLKLNFLFIGGIKVFFSLYTKGC